MRHIFLLSLLFSSFSKTALAAVAQPVPIPEDQSLAPQIEILGVGIATLGVGNTAEYGKNTSFNFGDSALVFGASQRLYDLGIGSFALGVVTTDSANRQTDREKPFFIHQAILSYQNQNFEVAIGRTDNQDSHFIDLPLLRADDLVTLTSPVNPFSNGINPQEHRYANVAEVTFNQNLNYFENIHAQHLINSADIGSDSAINSFGASFQYMAPIGLEKFSQVPLWGMGYEHIVLSQNTSSGLHQMYGGAVINLLKGVTNSVNLKFHDTLSLGSTLTSFKSTVDSFQADSNALAASLSYLHQPFGATGYQISLTAAYKNYFKVLKANTYGAALTGIKQLGAGFSAVAQYQGQWRDVELALVQSQGIAFENIFELGLLFNFDAIFNQHISPRRSLLNQQYNYIPN